MIFMWVYLNRESLGMLTQGVCYFKIDKKVGARPANLVRTATQQIIPSSFWIQACDAL